MFAINNYLPAKSFFRKVFFYVDVDGDEKLGQILTDHEIPFRIEKGTWVHDGYLIRVLHVKKRDTGKIIDIMQELSDKHCLCGHPEYPKKSRDLLVKILNVV